ncbi:hypothetical protein GCM10009563_17840 [Subtercola frigoramans]
MVAQAISQLESQWFPVCALSDLEPLWGEAALVSSGHTSTEQIALFRLPDDRVFAVSNADPATGAFVMSRGIVGSRGDRPTIASPLHKDVFDLQSGRCFTSPSLRLHTWRVRITNGVVEVARRPVLVAASHGTSDGKGQRAIADLVQAVREARPELTVVDAFVDVQQPDVPAAVASLASSSSAAVVPLLLSAGYHVHVDLAEAAKAASHEVVTSGALGPDRRLASVLARRLSEIGLSDVGLSAGGLHASDRVMLIAAGSSDASAVDDCHEMGRLLSVELRMPVTVCFLSASLPRAVEAIAAERATYPGKRIVAASYLLAPGYFATLAAEAGADATTAPLLRDDEDPPHELVEIVCDLYETALCETALHETALHETALCEKALCETALCETALCETARHQC